MVSTNASSNSFDLIRQSIRDAREGQPSSLGDLLDLYRSYLLAIANQEVGADIAPKCAPSDVVQETMYQAVREFGAFRGNTGNEFRSWLRQILVRNVCNAHRQFRESFKRDVSREVPWSSKVAYTTALQETPSQVLCHVERVRTIQAAIDRLPPDYRQVIQLRNFEQAEFDSIAARLGRTPEAIRKLWSRAVRKLTAELVVG